MSSLFNVRWVELQEAIETDWPSFIPFYFHFWAMIFILRDYGFCNQYHLLANAEPFCWYFSVVLHYFLTRLDDLRKKPHWDYHYSCQLDFLLLRIRISFDISSNSSFLIFSAFTLSLLLLLGRLLILQFFSQGYGLALEVRKALKLLWMSCVVDHPAWVIYLACDRGELLLEWS